MIYNMCIYVSAAGHTRHEQRRHRDDELILRRHLFQPAAAEASAAGGRHRVRVRIVPMICTVGPYTPPPHPPVSADSRVGAGRDRAEELATGGGDWQRTRLGGGWSGLRYWLLEAPGSVSSSCARS